MGFTPTTWTAGTAPGISSVQLNRIEAGINDLWIAKRDRLVVSSNYTLALADAGKIVEVGTSAVNLTVPNSGAVAFPVGTEFEIVAIGAGLVTVVEGAGVDVRTISTRVLLGQWAAATLYKRATDEWVLVGNLQPL